MVAQQSIEILVTVEESLILEALAQAEAPYSQRAQALLAVDAGSTLEQAAQVASLKVTQVRYWIGRFLNGRLGVFPDWLIEEMEASVQAAAPKSKKKKDKAKKPKAKGVGGKKGAKKTAKAKSKKGKKGGNGKAAKAKKKKGGKKSAKKKKQRTN
ncbi:MAG: hypothetical protein HKN69_04705 [Desulfofustis sp.]|nr:hypothetical protein [Desulfofustis sp.]